MRKLLPICFALWLVACQSASAIYLGEERFHGHNFFGTGADGAAVISSDTNLATTLGGPAVVKNYTSLTINSGSHLLGSSVAPCAGAIIYVKGNCDIEGNLSMTGAGNSAIAVPASGVNMQYAYTKASNNRGLVTDVWTNASGALGGGGGANVCNNQAGSAAGGSAGGANQTGGGGGGGGQDVCAGVGGVTGGAGTCYYGGLGGNGYGQSNGAYGGGLLVLVVGGNLTVGAAGSITSNGGQGGGTGAVNIPGGGGGGGGRIVILYAGTLNQVAGYAITANGGAGGAGGQYSGNGGAGGAGTISGPTQIAIASLPDLKRPSTRICILDEWRRRKYA